MKNVLSMTLLALTLVTGLNAHADAELKQCTGANASEATLKRCYNEAVSRQNVQMGSVFNQYASKKSQNYDQANRPEVFTRLEKAQTKWVEYTDAQCQVEALDALGGTGEEGVYFACLYNANEIRLAVLKK